MPQFAVNRLESVRDKAIDGNVTMGQLGGGLGASRLKLASPSPGASRGMRFLGLGLEDKVPDAKTIWMHRERLAQGGVIEALFNDFDAFLKGRGYLYMGGTLVRSIGKVRSKARIGLKNLSYNMRRLVPLEKLARAAPV